MPVSPTQRAATAQQQEGNNSTNGTPKLSRSTRRAKRQDLKERYAKVREDAQVAGLIVTTPEGAVRDERVDPRLQGCQQLPDIVRQSLRENWSTPDAAKPGIIGALLEPFFANDIVLDKDGNQIRVPPNRLMLIELAKTLIQLDHKQWERDHPEEAGKAKGGASASIQVNQMAATIVREMIEKRTPVQAIPPTTDQLPVPCTEVVHNSIRVNESIPVPAPPTPAP